MPTWADLQRNIRSKNFDQRLEDFKAESRAIFGTPAPLVGPNVGARVQELVHEESARRVYCQRSTRVDVNLVQNSRTFNPIEPSEFRIYGGAFKFSDNNRWIWDLCGLHRKCELRAMTDWRETTVSNSNLPGRK